MAAPHRRGGAGRWVVAPWQAFSIAVAPTVSPDGPNGPRQSPTSPGSRTTIASTLIRAALVLGDRLTGRSERGHASDNIDGQYPRQTLYHRSDLRGYLLPGRRRRAHRGRRAER